MKMKMASRNIASMHLFLEMKTKFPYLSEDILRDYVLLYAQDQAKCMSLLQKESENHFHLSHQFSDFRQNENKNVSNINENSKTNSGTENLNISFQSKRNASPKNSNIKKTNSLYKEELENTPFKNTKNPLQLSMKSTNLATFPETKSHSAPAVDDTERPFVSMFTSVPNTSHTVIQQASREPRYHNQMMFSTTKEHLIEPSETSNENNYPKMYPNSDAKDQSKRHAVQLSITPALPYQQQQLNVYSNTVCATASHLSRPGRHTTSLNFQLQPQSSDQYPLEISTVPTGMGKSCNYRDFGSHVQISVGAQGTTFTALRLQRPSASQKQNVEPSSNQVLPFKDKCAYTQASSQTVNSKNSMLPNQIPNYVDSTTKCGYTKNNDLPRYLQLSDPENINTDRDLKFTSKIYSQDELDLKKDFNNSSHIGQSFQTTPDYIQAVKTHQRAQLNIVQEELDKAKSIYSNLKSEVNRMEQELLKRRENNSSSNYVDIVKKLKEQNRQLRLECNCLLLEYDMCSKGQIPVGVTEEDFYSNIFTGPNDGLTLNSSCDKSNLNIGNFNSPNKVSEDEDDEKNSWKCKKCTFVNHPALEKCEMCEISKNSGYVEFKSNYSSSSHIQLVSPPEPQPKRAVGSVQISVTRRIPTYSKSVKFHLTHRIPR